MKLLILPGDGIGPEITSATLTVLERASEKFQLSLDKTTMEIGLKTLADQGTTFPQKAMEAARQADGILLGPISHLDYPSPIHVP